MDKIRYTNKQIGNFLRRLHYLIRHHNGRIEFKKLHGGITGYYYRGTDEMEIDYRRDIVATLIHESLHKWHPKWCETKVIRHERKIVNQLTCRQFKTLMKLIASNII